MILIFKKILIQQLLCVLETLWSVKKIAEKFHLGQGVVNNNTYCTTVFSPVYKLSLSEYYIPAPPLQYPIQSDSNDLREWLQFLKHHPDVSNVTMAGFVSISDLHRFSDAYKYTLWCSSILTFNKGSRACQIKSLVQ